MPRQSQTCLNYHRLVIITDLVFKILPDSATKKPSIKVNFSPTMELKSLIVIFSGVQRQKVQDGPCGTEALLWSVFREASGTLWHRPRTKLNLPPPCDLKFGGDLKCLRLKVVKCLKCCRSECVRSIWWWPMRLQRREESVLLFLSCVPRSNNPPRHCFDNPNLTCVTYQRLV